MHVQVVTYRLADISKADFIAANTEFAEIVATVPGLLAKIWLQGADANVHGGVYLWHDRAACESFLAGDLWAAVVGDASVIDLVSHDYAVVDEVTRLTQPEMALV